MTTITFSKNQDGSYLGFDCFGHAGYAKAGDDIVCAGISALVINMINSLDEYTADRFQTETDSGTGMIRLHLDAPAGHDAQLLFNSLVLGLQGIQNTYGKKYLSLKFREV